MFFILVLYYLVSNYLCTISYQAEIGYDEMIFAVSDIKLIFTISSKVSQNSSII